MNDYGNFLYTLSNSNDHDHHLRNLDYIQDELWESDEVGEWEVEEWRPRTSEDLNLDDLLGDALFDFIAECLGENEDLCPLDEGGPELEPHARAYIRAMLESIALCVDLSSATWIETGRTLKLVKKTIDSYPEVIDG